MKNSLIIHFFVYFIFFQATAFRPILKMLLLLAGDVETNPGPTQPHPDPFQHGPATAKSEKGRNCM